MTMGKVSVRATMSLNHVPIIKNTPPTVTYHQKFKHIPYRDLETVFGYHSERGKVGRHEHYKEGEGAKLHKYWVDCVQLQYQCTESYNSNFRRDCSEAHHSYTDCNVREAI